MPSNTSPKLARFFSAAAALCTVGLTALPASADSLPTRKSGLWEQKTVMNQGDGPRDHTMTLCIDDAMEKSTAEKSVKQHKESCTKYEIKKSDGKTEVVSDCVFNDRPVSSNTTMSGDFEKSFKIQIETKTTLTDKGRSRVMTRTIDQKGTYLGADCGDLKPGEAKGSNGDRIMVQ
ncbi:MAG: DUF3617 family protein [Filomicrobium sp.]